MVSGLIAEVDWKPQKTVDLLRATDTAAGELNGELEERKKEASML